MTIYDIAKLADTSPATVSRVINNKAGVSQKKREKILAVIKENNFTLQKPKKAPEPFSPQYESTSRGTVALLIDDPVSEYQSIGSTLFNTALYKNGYNTIIRCKDKTHDVNAILSELSDKDIAAIVMMGYSYTDKELIPQAIEKYFPYTPVILVRQSSNFGLKNVYCVGVDDQKGIGDCVQALVNRGRTHLALIMDNKLGEKEATKYYFQKAVEQYENLDSYCIEDVEYSIKGGEQAAYQVLKEHPGTDGILGVRDRIAIGLVYGLQKQGLVIPRDISVIGKDNSKLCEACNPPLTSLDSLLYDCAKMSIHLLLDIFDHKIYTHGILLTADIVHRGTL